MKLLKLMVIGLVALSTACSAIEFPDSPVEKTPLAENEVVYFVNSLRADCVGVAPMSCLQVQESEVQTQGEWQLFYSSIDGFSYEAGYIYKLLLKKEKIPLEKVPADASSIKYSLIEILEKTVDIKLRLNDIWALESISGEEILLSEGMQRPQLEIHLRDSRLIGTDGCNSFFANIELVDGENITFGPVAGTRKFCQPMEIPNRFNQQLNKVITYKLKDLILRFFDAEGEELLAFRKID